MQPPAEVDPARISQGEQALSSSAMLKMSAARAVSREEKLILRMESMIGRASKLVMSTCSTVAASSSALVLAGTGAFISETSSQIPLIPANAGTQIHPPTPADVTWVPAFAGMNGKKYSAPPALAAGRALGAREPHH